MKKISALFFMLVFNASFAQQSGVTSSEVYLKLQKLKVLGSAMYIAAHPDDENTLLLTWLSKDQKVQTAYIAMTRGDGGQNLIGTEQGVNAGILRTQELLKARSVDGAQQFFTRAIDFGYTKTTDEALTTWGKQKVLADLVMRIRKFKPDVLITRFPPDERAGHGHHSASAVLAAEAFDAAANPAMFPEQLIEVSVWQPKRLVWNYYSRGFRNQAPEEGAFIQVPLGNYNPIMGEAYTEIAAEARSMHKSQGFGSAKTRDGRSDYLLLVKGDKMEKSVFDGIDITWKRVKNGKSIEQLTDQLISTFDFVNPSKSVEQLIFLYKSISKLEQSHYKNIKLEEVQNLIEDCSGLWMEAIASNQFVSQNDSINVFFQTNNRTEIPVIFKDIKLLNSTFTINKKLNINELFEVNKTLFISKDYPITQPYWLIEKSEKGFYKVANEELVGAPFQPPAVEVNFTYEINNQAFNFKKPIIYKYVEPSIGEIYQPFIVRPEISVNFKESVFTFTNDQPKKVTLVLKSSKNNTKGTVSINLPPTWSIEPKSQSFEIAKKNGETSVNFKLFPPKNSEEVELIPQVQIGGDSYNRAIEFIDYKHIPFTTTFPVASAKAIYFDLKTKGTTIGYIKGAGDEVPLALQTMGYTVIELNATNFDIILPTLNTIVVGVRAYNTEDWLPNQQSKLMSFVEKGGALITQYQTSAFYGKIKADEMGPFPFKVGRERVTNEDSDVQFVDATHPLLNHPNKISKNDFEGWIQERGLYFAESWSSNYTTLLKMKDKGESELEGSLLYSPYGKGHFIFTGLSFFRQLPVGVPGAYRLFANLVSVGK